MQLIADSPPLDRGLLSLWAMLRFQADKFVYIMKILGDLYSWTEDPERLVQPERDFTRRFVNNQLTELTDLLATLKLPVSQKKARTVQHCWASLSEPGTDIATAARMVRNHAQELFSRIEDELDGKHIYFVGDHASLLEDSECHFGAAVAEAFPSALYDVDEAGKCLALKRSTACVMHLMRVMEVGLATLAKSLGCEVMTENWNTILNALENEIRARTKATHGEDWKEKDEPYYTGAVTHFRMVKNAWRNHAQHAKEKYTQEEADDIWHNTGAFMRHLSKRLSEDDGVVLAETGRLPL